MTMSPLIRAPRVTAGGEGGEGGRHAWRSREGLALPSSIHHEEEQEGGFALEEVAGSTVGEERARSTTTEEEKAESTPTEEGGGLDPSPLRRRADPHPCGCGGRI